MVKKDPLDWVIIGAGDGKLIRATWYQKVGGLPRFEAYDMADRSNQALYNQIIEEAKAESSGNVQPPRTEPKTEVKTQPAVQPKTQPKTNPKTPSTPIKRPDSKPFVPTVKTPLTIAFAPPIDEEGWCAVITKPTTAGSSKVEFRYERKESGAKVTCFATASAPKTVEPLADMDDVTTINAFLNGQKIGEYNVQKFAFDPATLDVKSWKAGNATLKELIRTDGGLASDYDLSDGVVGIGISPKQLLEIPEGAKRLVIWVRSDNSNNVLSSRLVDENGMVIHVDHGMLDMAADRNGWRAVIIPLVNLGPETSFSGQSAPVGKLKWDSILYIEPGDKANPKNGKIEFGPAAYEF